VFQKLLLRFADRGDQFDELIPAGKVEKLLPNPDWPARPSAEQIDFNLSALDGACADFAPAHVAWTCRQSSSRSSERAGCAYGHFL